MSVRSKNKKKYQTVNRASVKNIRTSPQKARLIIDLIRGKEVDVALQILSHNAKKSSGQTEKLLRTAIADARENFGANVDQLLITGGWVDQGPVQTRFMPRAHGRATQMKRKSAHITLELGTYKTA